MRHIGEQPPAADIRGGPGFSRHTCRRESRPSFRFARPHVALGRRAVPAPRREGLFERQLQGVQRAGDGGDAALQAQKLPQFRERGIRVLFHKLLQTLDMRQPLGLIGRTQATWGHLARFPPPLFKSPDPELAGLVLQRHPAAPSCPPHNLAEANGLPCT